MIDNHAFPWYRAFLFKGIHAREWISTATATYVIDSLLRAFSADDSAFSADDNAFQNADLTSVDYFIMPLVNPGKNLTKVFLFLQI